MNHTSQILDDTNIILAGFMGTGKTTVGQLIADQLGRTLIDTDTIVEATAGRTIAQIFADDGEAIFRELERQACQEAASQTGIVISVGGGAVVDLVNRETLAHNGTLFCLTASPDEIVQRIVANSERPLLEDVNQREYNAAKLLRERRHAYAAIPHHIQTDGVTPEVVAQRILSTLAGMSQCAPFQRIPVQTPLGTYAICIGHGLLAHTGLMLQNQGLVAGPAAIVTNPAIAQHYGNQVVESLQTAGFEPHICTVPEGEEYKTLASIHKLYDQILAAGLDRRSPVIALGGGVIGDMAGFVAATYLRGVPFVQIPTSLLSMVDASVGGKTGVDVPQGKNLIGAFKQPEIVLMDPDVFESLPAAEFRSGLAEVIKHGIIGAPKLFEQLEQDGPGDLSQLLVDAVQVKVDVVEEDPYERGRRATLNLGHTFGHAIELVSEFDVRHGEGVALGLVASAHMAADLGYCSPMLAHRITNAVQHLELPIKLSGYDSKQIMAAMSHDKKRVGKTLRFIIPQALGDVTIFDHPGDVAVQKALEKILE